MTAGLLDFLDKIEGDGYGGMFVFESARTDAKELVAENGRLTKERDLALANADAVYARLMPEVERLRSEVAGLKYDLHVARLNKSPDMNWGTKDLHDKSVAKMGRENP